MRSVCPVVEYPELISYIPGGLYHWSILKRIIRISIINMGVAPAIDMILLLVFIFVFLLLKVFESFF